MKPHVLVCVLVICCVIAVLGNTTKSARRNERTRRTPVSRRFRGTTVPTRRFRGTTVPTRRFRVTTVPTRRFRVTTVPTRRVRVTAVSTRRTRVTTLPTRRTKVTAVSPKDNVTKPFNCSLEHRNHPESDNMFQKKWNNVWRNYTCPIAGLVWDQETCRCDYGPEEIDPCAEYSPVPGYPKSYIRTVWGRNFTLACGYLMVWSQEECTCRFGDAFEIAWPGAADQPCELMMNATFDSKLNDDARGNFIGRYPWSRVKIEQPRGAYGTGAACVKGGYLTVPMFNKNEFSRTFQIQLRFKMDDDDDDDDADQYTTLVSNGCFKDRPSISVGYRNRDRSFVVDISDHSQDVSYTCTARSRDDWKDVSLEMKETEILLMVNGEACIQEKETYLTDQPVVTRCPLSFGGDNRGVSKNLRGCIENVIVRRYCIL